MEGNAIELIGLVDQISCLGKCGACQKQAYALGCEECFSFCVLVIVIVCFLIRYNKKECGEVGRIWDSLREGKLYLEYFI